MDRLTTAALAAALLAFGPLRVAARAETLTLERMLALARERAPRILAAGARIEEARGRLTGASVLLRENPVVEAAAGPRDSDDRDTVDREVGIRQGFELDGQRRARVDGAEADVARASAARDDSARRLLREVAVAFYKGLHAQESLRNSDAGPIREPVDIGGGLSLPVSAAGAGSHSGWATLVVIAVAGAISRRSGSRTSFSGSPRPRCGRLGAASASPPRARRSRARRCCSPAARPCGSAAARSPARGAAPCAPRC